MKLTSINCPNCNGQLREEAGKLICVSCGSAFAIDYDEADVEHEKLQTEAERERIRVEREKELMATKIRLEEEAQIRRAERTRKQAFNGITKIIAIPLILMFVGSFLSLIIFAIIGSHVKKDAKNRANNILFTDSTKNTTVYTEPAIDEVPKKAIVEDQSFVENALASGKSFAKNKHSKAVHDYDLKSELGLKETPEAVLTSDPRIENIYFVETGTENFFIMFFALDYTYPDVDTDRVRTMHYSCFISNISVNEAGNISSNYQVGYDTGTGSEGLFYAYNDKDQLYRETVLAKGGNITDLTADLVTEG